MAGIDRLVTAIIARRRLALDAKPDLLGGVARAIAARRLALDAEFNEGDHPRGQPGNAGEFGPGRGEQASVSKTEILKGKGEFGNRVTAIVNPAPNKLAQMLLKDEKVRFYGTPNDISVGVADEVTHYDMRKLATSQAHPMAESKTSITGYITNTDEAYMMSGTPSLKYKLGNQIVGVTDEGFNDLPENQWPIALKRILNVK